MKKVLVIDDEKIFTRTIKRTLEAAGSYEVEVENQGVEALHSVQRFKPDLIFLDIVMPDLEGAEVALQIKADHAVQNIPIVFPHGRGDC